MKKNTVKYIVGLLMSVVLSLAAVMPMQKAEADRSDWMLALEDQAALNAITIPGTHDSGALHSIADISGKCQSLSIQEQLKVGVRFFDIRLQLVDNELRVVHSITDQMTDFVDVLSDMVSFLRGHQSEFLIVSIKEDASPKRSDREFTATLEEMLLSYSEISRGRELPATVGAARGGIHILARYRDASIGVPCHKGWKDNTSFTVEQIFVQDHYRLESTEEKIADIRKAYSEALEKKYALVLNYTSCYLTSCFPPIYAGIPAHDINRETQTAMVNESGPLGILVCDFMTSKLAEAIIGRNFK